MNPSCSVCESAATRVCQHKECTLSPFLCSGPCAKNASEKLHTHNSEKNFISYEEFEKRVERTKRLLDPYNLHKEYLEEMRKKVNVAKEHLKKKIDDCLERFYQQLENEVCVEIKLQLIGKEEEIVKKINVDFNNNSLFSGKDLNELWRNQYTFRWQRKFEAQVECMKKAFDKQLKEIEQMSIKQQDEFPSFKRIVEESWKLCYEGRKLLNDERYKQSLVKFKEARQINNFDTLIHYYIGDCLFELDQLDEAEESYKTVLLLLPRYHGACCKIGQIYQKRKNFEEAINWHSKAIQIDKRWSDYFSNRGECFLELKRFEQASVDFFTASKLAPYNVQFKTKIQQIAKLMITK